MSFGKVSALPKRTFGEREKSDFLLSLQQVDWSGVDALALSEGPDVAYSAFINQYMILYDKFFPYKTNIKSGKLNIPRQPWMTTALLNSCKRKSKLYKKYLKIHLTSISQNSLNSVIDLNWLGKNVKHVITRNVLHNVLIILVVLGK